MDNETVNDFNKQVTPSGDIAIMWKPGMPEVVATKVDGQFQRYVIKLDCLMKADTVQKNHVERTTFLDVSDIHTKVVIPINKALHTFVYTFYEEASRDKFFNTMSEDIYLQMVEEHCREMDVINLFEEYHKEAV